MCCVGIHSHHHLVSATGKYTPVFTVHGEAGRALAWRKRPAGDRLQTASVDLQQQALILKIVEDESLPIRHREFRVAVPLCPLKANTRCVTGSYTMASGSSPVEWTTARVLRVFKSKTVIVEALPSLMKPRPRSSANAMP